MNEIMTTSAVQTMTSREIAELTGKDHRHILADARVMLESLEIDCAGFSAQYKDASGKSNIMFILPKRETHILVSGYSIPMRAKIIDRWQELEAGTAISVPQTLSSALRLAADQSDYIEAQKLQLAIVVPKAVALDLIASTEGSMCVRVAAKDLKQKPSVLTAWLKANKWIYKSGTSHVAYQACINAGLMVQIVKHNEATDVRVGYTSSQACITNKGLAKLALKLSSA